MVCSGCRAVNAPTATHCYHCGQPLGAPARAGAAVHTAWSGALAALAFRNGPWAGRRWELQANGALTIGRSPENHLVLDHPSVSRHHARLQQQDGRWRVEDLGSRNGTWVNGEAVSGGARVLRPGDVVRLGEIEAVFQLASSGADHQRAAVAAAAPADALVLGDGQVLPLAGERIEIGRSPSSDIVLDDITISRTHARLERLPQGWLLLDLGSSNGTWVNGQRLTGPALLRDGDTIAFGRLRVTFRAGQGTTPPAGQTLHVRPQADRYLVEGARRPADLLALRPLGPPLIVLQQVFKSYRTSAGPQQVLRGVSLTVHAGEFVAIVGPSGCGKSTLLNVITGIDRPDRGQVTVAGHDILRMGTDALARWRGRHIGIVFQFFQLLPTLTVLENVMLPMAFCNTYRGQREARALECLRLVGMEAVARRLPSALSGGQQQRVAIARALANDPPILVGDEPTGNLDSRTSQEMFELFTQLVAAGKTMVMVTHDPEIAHSIPRRVEMLDGQIVAAS
ncbi:MAG TPA: FHA domain-containing protein [Chloroflexota bacterium]|jgi:putative ABC transport system ATP-binding protein|nr:FHA domain-containing protein [Chloroflexota bacterium]